MASVASNDFLPSDTVLNERQRKWEELFKKYEQVDDEEEWDSTYCTEELTSNASHTDDETILVDDDDERSECEEAKSDHEEDDANFNVVEFLDAMRHVTKRRVLQWKKNHEEHTEEEIVKPDQTRIKSRRSVVTSVEGQQMDERVMGNAKWPDRRRSLNGLIPRLSIASPPSPKNGDDQLVPCQPSNNGTIQVHNSNDQNDGYYEMSTVTTTKTVVTTQVVKRFVPNPNASPIIETIELDSPSPLASPTALATPSPRKRAKTRDESFDTGDDFCAEHDSAIGETPKMSKKNSNGRLSTSTALVLHTPHLRRNPGILIPTPKRSTKKNSDSDKVIYRRNRIKNILLDASKGSLIDKKEIIRDACQIECEQDAELRVVPRDIDQKGVEEVVERTRNDKTLDILSELGKLTPKAIYIKERKIKD